MNPTFAGELQLAGWSESHTSGCKVTFWLSSPDELEAFRALTVRKGNTAGHRFMAALVEIGDDEKPVSLDPREAALETKIREPLGDACWRTVMWCSDPKFWDFLNQQFPSADTVTNSAEAAELVKFMCTVESRKELDSDPKANELWNRIIRKPYSEFLRSQK